MASYTFSGVVVNKPSALDKQIRQTVAWVADYIGLEVSTNVKVNVSRALTTPELDQLTTLVNSYVDPAEFLTLNRTEIYPMDSKYADATNPITAGGKYVLQTIIFANRNEPSVVLDSIKTIVEYQCPNLLAFSLNSASKSITLEIYDVSRDVVIATQTIALSEIDTAWDQQALSNPTGASTKWRSAQFYNLYKNTTNYDCIWQFRGTSSHPALFSFKINSLQYLFYDVE